MKDSMRYIAIFILMLIFFNCNNSVSPTKEEIKVELLDLPINKNMVLIPSKESSFNMGQMLYNGDTTHIVKFTYNFWMDTSEVTQYEYSNLMRDSIFGFIEYNNPPWDSIYGLGDNFPVYLVNFYDAALFCNARSKKEGLDTVYSYSSIYKTPGNDCIIDDLSINYQIKGYRLPTEAEWEFACRGGSTTDFYWGNDSTFEVVNQFAWYVENSDSSSHPVALKQSNSYRLYDMCGNIYELCNDWYDAYTSIEEIDPIGPDNGKLRCMRGGRWSSSPYSLLSAKRLVNSPPDEYISIGFRCVLNEEIPEKWK